MDLDPRKVKAYYEAHPSSGSNVFYRMQAELPVDGRFDPEAFAYQAHVTGSGPFLRVAHLAALKRDFTFALPAGNLPQGQSEASPHDSFRFAPEFMRRCARQVGVKPVDLITDGQGFDIHVFEKLAAASAEREKRTSRHGATGNPQVVR